MVLLMMMRMMRRSRQGQPDVSLNLNAMMIKPDHENHTRFLLHQMERNVK
jgi:hypothetical protein